MPRIRPAETTPAAPEAADRAARIQSTLAGILSYRPEVAGPIGEAIRALGTTGTLSPRLRELIRLRIAFHNQCRSCMAMRYTEALEDGLTEDLVCSLERPEEADDLTEAERSALRFADMFANNHLAIDDSVYDDLRKYFSENQLVEIGLNCALDVGMGRLAATWLVTDDLPEKFRQEDSVVTPWGGDMVVMPAMS